MASDGKIEHEKELDRGMEEIDTAWLGAACFSESILQFTFAFPNFDTSFLDASSHLYKWLCPSVRPSVSNPFVKQRETDLITTWG